MILRNSLFGSFARQLLCASLIASMCIAYSNGLQLQFSFQQVFYWADNKIWGIPKENIMSSSMIVSTIPGYPRKDFWAFDNSSLHYNTTYKGFEKRMKVVTKYVMNITTYYYQLRDVYVSSSSSFSFENGKVNFNNAARFRHAVEGPVVGCYNELIVLGHFGTRGNYGHMFQDYFHCLLMLPEELIKRCNILANLMGPGQEALELLGFSRNRMVFSKDNEWIFVKHVHTITNSSAFLSHYAEGCVKLREKFFEGLKLHEIEATKYIFCNRGTTGFRYISNLDEVISEAKKTFPDIKWETIPDYIPHLNQTARIWTSIKLVFCPTGSNQAKIYFMKPSTVMVSALFDLFDSSLAALALCCKVFLVQFMACDVSHWKRGGGAVNVTDSIKSIRHGLYALEHQRWPNSKDLVKHIY